MDIREKQSFIALLVESFRLVNRCFSSILAFVIYTIIIGGVLVFALLFLRIPSYLVAIVQLLFFAFVNVVFTRLLATRAEGDNLSIPDISADSFLSTVYFVILQLLLGIAGIGFMLIARLLDPRTALWLVPVILFLVIRLIFTQIIIATREQNPITALCQSWQITSGRFFYTLGMVLVSGLLPLVFFAVVLYSLYVGIPLFFAGSFDLTNLSVLWICVFIGLCLCSIELGLAMKAYWIIVFLNLDYQDNRGGGLAERAAMDMPNSQLVQAPTTVTLQGATENAFPTPQQPQQEVQILQASVKTQTGDDALIQHLDQVYQPKQQDFVQYTEEDRMPTILFDDEMSKEIEESRRQWEEEKNKSRRHAQNKENDDGDSPKIKMSK